MFYFFYNIFSLFLLLPVVLYHLYRSLSRDRQPAFAERFGLIPVELRLKCDNRKVIWVHAVSVGETIASRPLLKILRSRYPDHLLLLSNTTETGKGVAATFQEIDGCFYFPFDFYPSVCMALNRIKPAMVIIMETEIWPNFNREATARAIPVFLANGRISDRSFKRYLTFSWFFRHPLHCFSALCMQSESDRERIIAIGAPPDKTFAAGNLKYDIAALPPSAEKKQQLRQEYGIPGGAIVLMAASTHPGEEAYLIECYRSMLALIGELFLVLVPRHPERGEEVAALLKSAGIRYVRRSAHAATLNFSPGEALLVDTIGEMMKLYSLSDVAFVGGSLVPTGGHNLLEPASVGVPSLFGPYTTNFREITELVLHYGAGIQVASHHELGDAMKTLVLSCELRCVLGNNGLKLMRDNGGATERHVTIFEQCV